MLNRARIEDVLAIGLLRFGSNGFPDHVDFLFEFTNGNSGNSESSFISANFASGSCSPLAHSVF